MGEEFVPLGNREDNTQEEGFGGADKDSVEEMEEDNLDLSDEGNECSSDGVSSWGILPDVCLRQVFAFLSDRDRLSASLVCRHWHHGMRAPSLWRSRFFYFTGQRSIFWQSEHCSAVTYARSLGAYLKRLDVCVHPPRKRSTARRLEKTIRGLLSELTR